MRAPGFNPMRWDCKRDGCFNANRRPKIEVFAECFPRRINFGDVDGIVEIGGAFCLLEWKGKGGKLGAGQVLAYQAFTSIPNNLVLVVEGNPETMEVDRYRVFVRGAGKAWKSGSLGHVKRVLRSWAEWRRNRIPSRVFHFGFGCGTLIAEKEVPLPEGRPGLALTIQFDDVGRKYMRDTFVLRHAEPPRPARPHPTRTGMDKREH